MKCFLYTHITSSRVEASFQNRSPWSHWGLFCDFLWLSQEDTTEVYFDLILWFTLTPPPRQVLSWVRGHLERLSRQQRTVWEPMTLHESPWRCWNVSLQIFIVIITCIKYCCCDIYISCVHEQRALTLRNVKLWCRSWRSSVILVTMTTSWTCWAPALEEVMTS